MSADDLITHVPDKSRIYPVQPKRGRPCLYGKPMSNAQRQRRYRLGKTGR